MPRGSKGKHERQFPVFKASVLQWYTPERWERVYPYLQCKTFSRRFLEHFITEYARSHSCTYPLTDPLTGEVFNFNVYHSAQTVLAGVHKRHMDPFGRKNKNAADNGRFVHGFGDKVCEVSVCELVFFRWALKHNVMKYAEEHADEIRADMASMARVKRVHPVSVEQIIIEVPQAPTNPLQDIYWEDSVKECMQQPKRRRKRYRESTVDMVMNNKCELTAAI